MAVKFFDVVFPAIGYDALSNLVQIKFLSPIGQILVAKTLQNFTENFRYITSEGSFHGLRMRISYSGLGPESQYTTIYYLLYDLQPLTTGHHNNLALTGILHVLSLSI